MSGFHSGALALRRTGRNDIGADHKTLNKTFKSASGVSPDGMSLTGGWSLTRLTVKYGRFQRFWSVLSSGAEDEPASLYWSILQVGASGYPSPCLAHGSGSGGTRLFSTLPTPARPQALCGDRSRHQSSGEDAAEQEFAIAFLVLFGPVNWTYFVRPLGSATLGGETKLITSATTGASDFSSRCLFARCSRC